MKRPRASALVLAAALQAACFQSEAPLGPPGEAPLDPKLVGVWQCRPPDDDAHAAMTVLPFDKTQYFVEWRERGDGEIDRYRAYPSAAADRTILNVRELEETPEGGWIFVRYTFEADGRLRLFVVDEDALGTRESAAGLGILRRRAADNALYREFAGCTK